MQIEAVGTLMSSLAASDHIRPPVLEAPPAAAFDGWLSQEIQSVNAKLVHADHQVQQAAVGDAVSLHEVMIDLEEARLSFQLLAQVRNKLLEAYQEVMRMQV